MKNITKEIKELDKIRTATKADICLLQAAHESVVITIGGFSGVYTRYATVNGVSPMISIGIKYVSIPVLRDLIATSKDLGKDIYTDGSFYICGDYKIPVESFNQNDFVPQYKAVNDIVYMHEYGIDFNYISETYTTDRQDIDFIRAITSSASSPGERCCPPGTNYHMQVFYSLCNMNKADTLRYMILDAGERFTTVFEVNKSGGLKVTTCVGYFKLVTEEV